MRKITLLFAGAMLAGCGGGGGSSSTSQPPASTPAIGGIYNGTTAQGRQIGGVVQSNGRYWLMYSAQGSSLAAGFIQGDAVQNGSQFTSSNAKDFNLESRAVYPATVTGTVQEKQLISGVANYGPNATNSFSMNYDATASQTAINTLSWTGSYTGQAGTLLGSESVNAYLQSTDPNGLGGNFTATGASSGCKISGTFQNASDKGVVQISGTFDNNPRCAYPGVAVVGVGVYNQSTKMLRAALISSDRSKGVMLIAQKST